MYMQYSQDISGYFRLTAHVTSVHHGVIHCVVDDEAVAFLLRNLFPHEQCIVAAQIFESHDRSLQRV